MSDLNAAIFSMLLKRTGGKKAQFPPPAIVGLKPNFLEHIPDKFFKASFPVKEAYNNPFGITFGGYYGCFFDATFGPFSGITAKQPTTSLDMNITFLKPLSPADETVIVEAEILSLSKSYITMQGKAYSGRGVLVATCTSRLLILNR